MSDVLAWGVFDCFIAAVSVIIIIIEWRKPRGAKMRVFWITFFFVMFPLNLFCGLAALTGRLTT